MSTWSLCCIVHYPRQILCLILIVSFRILASSTTVSVIRTPRHIVVGADSLVTNEGVGPSYECKISSHGDVFFASAGIREDKQSGFFSVGLAIRAIEHSANVGEAATRFTASATDAFRIALERIRHDAPRYYVNKVKTRPEPLQMVFFGMERGIPTYALVYFTATDKSHGHIVVTPHLNDCPGHDCPDAKTGRSGRILGENVAAKRASDTKSFWRDLSDTEAARKLVAIEEAESPSDVGGEIDVVTLDANGVHWAQPQHACK